MNARSAVIGVVGAMALSIAFCALGAWQLGRAELKARMLTDYARALADAPVELAASIGEGAPTPRRVRGAGRFDPAATVLLDNQVLDGRAGAHVITLFVPDGGTRAVLVDRGWIALPPDRVLPTLAAPDAARVEIAGLLMPPPATGIRMGDAHGERSRRRLLNHLDVQMLARDFGVSLYDGVLWLDPDAPDGFARRWQALPNTMPPERHRAYAVQWFALAAATLITCGVLMWRNRRKS